MKKIILLILIFACTFLASCNVFAIKDSTGASTSSPLAPSYTVKFRTNGGTAVSSLTCSTLVSAPKTEREGFEFLGWYRDESCETPAIYPLEIKSNTTLYAKWLQLRYEATGQNFSIKFMDNNKDSSKGFSVSPNLDFEALAQKGYRVNVEITYDVYYVKDYDVLWDIGYLGAPKFESYLYEGDKLMDKKENVTATLSPKTKTLSFTTSASSLRNADIRIVFSTDNIQNKICFKNLSAVVTCFK